MKVSPNAKNRSTTAEFYADLFALHHPLSEVPAALPPVRIMYVRRTLKESSYVQTAASKVCWTGSSKVVTR